MVDRRVAAGTVQLDHQHGGLGERYVAGRMLEVELGRRFDAVGSFAEIDQIEVPLQNLVLGEPALQLNRPPQLDQLAPDGDLGTVGVDRPGKLLGNGRAAGPEASRDHVPGGADRIGYAKPAMLEKVAILAGEERLYQVRRQLLIADDVSFLVAGKNWVMIRPWRSRIWVGNAGLSRSYTSRLRMLRVPAVDTPTPTPTATATSRQTAPPTRVMKGHLPEKAHAGRQK